MAAIYPGGDELIGPVGLNLITTVSAYPKGTRPLTGPVLNKRLDIRHVSFYQWFLVNTFAPDDVIQNG